VGFWILCTYSVAKNNFASNTVLKKLGFSVEKEGVFNKRGTDIFFEEFVYAFKPIYK